jgi:putative transposase
LGNLLHVNLLHVNLHAAYKSVTIAICDTLERASEKYPSIPAYSDDADYRGTSVKFTYEKRKLKLHYFSKTIKGNCAVLPKRRVVEHTFSWLNHSRRLAKSLEILKWTSENMMQIAMIRITQCKIRLMFCRQFLKRAP